MALDAVRQKIARSAEHLKSATEEVQRYIDSKPGNVEAEIEPNSNRVILKFIAKTPVPDAVSIILGDAIQNLRSSLDYLVWELVIAANGSPGDKHMFPICNSLDSFKHQITRKRLDGLTAEAVTEIQRLQPYNSGQQAPTHLLRILDSLCNINKHWRILLIALAAHYSRTEIIGATVGHSVQTTLDPRYHGAEIAVGPAFSPVGTEEAEMKGNVSYFVTFNEGAVKGVEMATCVNQLWHFVDNTVLPKFERFFV
jgi:hypothetical protein